SHMAPSTGLAFDRRKYVGLPCASTPGAKSASPSEVSIVPRRSESHGPNSVKSFPPNRTLRKLLFHPFVGSFGSRKGKRTFSGGSPSGEKALPAIERVMAAPN